MQIKGKPAGLPDVTYQNATAMSKKKKTLRAYLVEVVKYLENCLVKYNDPRYSIFNAMTNLSSVARTATYFDDVAAQNRKVQQEGGRGFFWDTEDIAKEAVNHQQQVFK